MLTNFLIAAKRTSLTFARPVGDYRLPDMTFTLRPGTSPPNLSSGIRRVLFRTFEIFLIVPFFADVRIHSQ
jgi:hypothetical protein